MFINAWLHVLVHVTMLRVYYPGQPCLDSDILQHISVYKDVEPCIVGCAACTHAIQLFLTPSSGNCRAMLHNSEAQMCT